ncbi:MAG: M56 family metallopeptidase [Pseudohongiella sp.]|nr:M56 family metallopeptidase [Pseudohongiella sp.]
MDKLFVLNEMVTLATMLDLLLKSAVILSVFLLLNLLLAKRIRSHTQHQLWMNAFLCLVLLPALPTLINQTAPQLANTGAWFEIIVTPESMANVPSASNYSWLLTLYFLPTLWLIIKMCVALIHLRRIQRYSEPLTCTATQGLLSDLAKEIGITRSVVLRRSHQISSPMSFGLLRPHIILPAQSHDWSVSVMTDVLLHELSHIKRLDWITMLLAWFVAAIYWINPLVWFALKRLNDEAENSCDSAVLLAGRSDTDYAESLLSVAQACVYSGQSKRPEILPAQMMLDRSTLKNRIHRILEEHNMNTSDSKTTSHVKTSLALMLLVSAATLFGIGGAQFVSAQQPSLILEIEADSEMIPTNNVEPVYPTRAFQRKVEGWVQVKFTVTAAGTVDPQSVEVVDSEPRGMFENSAIKATPEFTFNPRIRNGLPVEVPNVQYVFRYLVSEEPEQQAPR